MGLGTPDLYANVWTRIDPPFASRARGVGLPAWTNLSVTSANQARLEQAYMIRGARRRRLARSTIFSTKLAIRDRRSAPAPAVFTSESSTGARPHLTAGQSTSYASRSAPANALACSSACSRVSCSGLTLRPSITFNHGVEGSSPSALTKYSMIISGLQPPLDGPRDSNLTCSPHVRESPQGAGPRTAPPASENLFLR